MKQELIQFIRENKLSPFNSTKTVVDKGTTIYKTRDAKQINSRVISKISEYFAFADSANLLNFFEFTENKDEIKKRQDFFNEIKNIGKKDNKFLSQINIPKAWWKPEYDVAVVTENSDTFTKLKEKGIPVQLVISETDIALLEGRDIVQIINCEDYSLALENLPQSVFIKNPEEVYLERHLETLSGWKNNLEILEKNEVLAEMKKIVEELNPTLNLTSKNQKETISREDVESKIESINKEISQRIKELTISGESLVAILSKKDMPEEIKKIIRQTIDQFNIPPQVINAEIPVSIDEEELERLIQKENTNKYANLAEKIKSSASVLKEVPKKLQELSELLIFFDFVAGISQFICGEMKFPEFGNALVIEESKNLFLDNPQPISFYLNQNYLCSILTGANSGGKTTLVEHIIQLISLSQIGLPVYGRICVPLFTDVYYFAKNKGSASKGAFETLLSQMASIEPGSQTLILADEIESVTEPGVAGKIIAATADFFIKQGCFLVIATHLGHEIQHILPEKTRIDGIEAKGLDKNFELIVDHNPVLGRLANSTPELIVEKMANSEMKDYFIHLNNWLKKKGN